MNPSRERVGVWIAIFGAGVLVLAGIGFAFKIFQFLQATLRGEVGFALVHVTTYLIVALGLCALFVSAVVAGQLRDVEGPKHRMLEREEALERQER